MKIPKHGKFDFIRIFCVVAVAIFCFSFGVGCSNGTGSETESEASGEDATGNLENAPVGTWRAELPFYKLGFTQISELRTGNITKLIDDISESVRVELVFGENGEFFCLADREATLAALNRFGTGFLEILNDASVETLAEMKKMSVGDFENVLSSHGKTKEDFAVEVSESLMRFFEKKSALFDEYEPYGDTGLCVLYKGVYAVRVGRLYVGKTSASVFDKGSMIAERNGSTLHISSDTDLHYFDDCTFSLVSED